MVARYLQRVNQESLRAEATAAGGQTRDITLGVAADGRTWLRLTEERIDHGDLRFGHTLIDGGREGREVLWNSTWSWWLEWLGRARAGWTSEALPRGGR